MSDIISLSASSMHGSHCETSPGLQLSLIVTVLYFLCSLVDSFTIPLFGQLSIHPSSHPSIIHPSIIHPSSLHPSITPQSSNHSHPSSLHPLTIHYTCTVFYVTVSENGWKDTYDSWFCTRVSGCDMSGIYNAYFKFTIPSALSLPVGKFLGHCLCYPRMDCGEDQRCNRENRQRSLAKMCRRQLQLFYQSHSKQLLHTAQEL